MNNEEIDYWLRYFSNHNHGFMSEDGKKITLFKVFQELKELHYLLKIKNDYINELESYKYNLDRDYLKLEKENKELKDNWNELKKELKDNFEEFRYVEDECLRTMAQEDDSILFSMKCIEKGGMNE